MSGAVGQGSVPCYPAFVGRVYKPLVFWAATEEGRAHPQTARLQLDTGADRTILARMPPGARVKGKGCINGKTVRLIDIVAFIPETSCNAALEVAVPWRRNSLPTVIGADFFQAAKAVLDYKGEIIGCPRGRRARKGFAGGERTGLLRFQPGRCPR